MLYIGDHQQVTLTTVLGFPFRANQDTLEGVTGERQFKFSSELKCLFRNKRPWANEGGMQIDSVVTLAKNFSCIAVSSVKEKKKVTRPCCGTF